jgi:hypothetical protein
MEEDKTGATSSAHKSYGNTVIPRLTSGPANEFFG